MKGRGRGNYMHFKGPSRAYLAKCDRELADPDSSYWQAKRYQALLNLRDLVGQEKYEAWIDALPDYYDKTATAKEWCEAAQAELEKLQGEKQ